MRELTCTEIGWVAGGTGECTPENSDGSGNEYGGISNPEGIADDLINFYEGLVETTSYIIERVANAL